MKIGRTSRKGMYVEQCDGNKLMYFYVNNRSKSHEILETLVLLTIAEFPLPLS